MESLKTELKLNNKNVNYTAYVDLYNASKLWIVRTYKSGHKSLQYAIIAGDIVSASKIVRMQTKHVNDVIGKCEIFDSITSI